jgi:hypothetical protein
MKNAILVPGRPDKDQHYDPDRPSNSEDFWFGWLRRQLIIRDIHAVAIEPPMPFRPRYNEWRKEFERFDVSENTLLVGHSCGGGFLIRWLSENKDKEVGKVVLVAPWLNPDDNPKSDTADFFDFEIEPNLVKRTKGVVIFVSHDDDQSVIESVNILRDKIHSLILREYSDKGHFTTKSLGTNEFTELLEECLR